jgi:ribosomal-protein-alanine N-acetyltransferase
MKIELPLTLSSGPYLLKTLTTTDAHLLLNYYLNNRDHFESWSPLPDKDFYTLDFQKKKLAFDEETMKSNRALRLWIFNKDNMGNIIGDISYSNIVRGPFQSCNVGYKTDVNHLRQGIMLKCLKESFRYIFSILKLHRIEANIIPSNGPSLNLIKKLGFIEEGYAKEYLNINGKWEDHIRYSLLSTNI